jgi:hypothetical protein
MLACRTWQEWAADAEAAPRVKLDNQTQNLKHEERDAALPHLAAPALLLTWQEWAADAEAAPCVSSGLSRSQALTQRQRISRGGV